MQTAFPTQPPQTPENSLGFKPVPAKPETAVTPEQLQNSEVANARDLLRAAYGEVAVGVEAQKPAAQEAQAITAQAKYTDEVLVTPVATVELSKQAEPIPTAGEAVQIVTSNAEATRNERLAQVAIDLERGGYGLAA